MYCFFIVNVNLYLVAYSYNTGIIDGIYAIVFASPEVLKSERWREHLKNERFRAMVSVVAIDEAHCVIQW